MPGKELSIYSRPKLDLSKVSWQFHLKKPLHLKKHDEIRPKNNNKAKTRPSWHCMSMQRGKN
jgi:hypothetical protein